LKSKTGTEKKIYIAGPLFSSHERSFLEEIVKTLSEKLTIDPIRDVFLPHRDAGEVDVHGKKRGPIFDEDMRRLEEADIIIALLDGIDVERNLYRVGLCLCSRKRDLRNPNRLSKMG